jgi:hypothetical protein
MPRYYFHYSTNTRFTDDVGDESATPADARRAAIKACSEMLHNAEDAFWGSRPWAVTVTDAKGNIMYGIAVDGFSSDAVD